MTALPHPQSLDDLTEDARTLLQGAIDIHAHAAPDPFAERKLDARELVRDSRDAGLAAVVIKSHEYPTQPLAWALASEFPDITIHGAIALDHPVGGLNPDALETALRIGTRVVWMPTFDSAWSRERFGRWNSKAEGMTVLDPSGALIPVVHELLELIATHNATLCTGHLSPEETRATVAAARQRDIRTIVTHATSFFIPLEVQHEASALGAYIEQCGNNIFREGGTDACANMLAEARAVGPEHVILSTDLGQATNPHPTVGFGAWIQVALDAGFTRDEVARMVQANPATALG